MRVLISVEDIDGRELANGKDHPVGGLGASELVQIGIEFFGAAAEIDRLAQKDAREPGVRIPGADLIGLAARETGDTQRVGQTESLVDFRIDP